MFTKDEKTRIESHIQAAEGRTSGEIVVSVVHSSGDYGWTHWTAAAIGCGAASAVLAWDYYHEGWGLTIVTLIGWQLVGAAVGSIVSLVPAISRLFVRKRVLAAHVHHECLAHFTALGIHETEDRTGILIFLSEFERRVQILADKGIHEAAGEGYWKEQIDQIVLGIKLGKSTESLCSAIDRIADKLAKHFPPKPGHKNELSNKVRDDSQIRD